MRGYVSRDVSCGDGCTLEQPKTRYESQDRCGSGRLLSYQGRREESELKIEHRTESDELLMRKSIGSFFLA